MRPKTETEHKSNEILNEVEELSSANEFRNVGTTVFFIDQISECRATALRNAIFDQLSYLLYDKETERRQYENYIKHLLVSDLSEKNPCSTEDLKILSEKDLPMNALDDITVPIYLDALLDLVQEKLPESLSNMEEESTKSSSSEEEAEDVDSFIATSCKITVFEYSNKLLYNTLASELPESHYQKALNMYKIAANLRKLYDTQAFVKAGMRPSLDVEQIYLSEERDFNVFCMPLSKNTFMQKLKSYCDEADESEIFYNIMERSISFSFHQLPFSFMEMHKVTILRTRVCFRDYLKHVAPSIGRFIEDQEKRYEMKKSLAKIEQEFEEPKTIYTKRDFYRKSSIKEKLAGDEKLSTKLKEKDNKPDTVSPKHIKDINKGIAPELPKDNVVFAGYKLGEDILRVRVLEAKYKSTATQLNLERFILYFGSEWFFLKLIHGGNTILFNKVNPTNHNIARLRIETYNFINITFDHMPMPLPEDETEGQEAENELDYNISYPQVTMTWPSLLKVQNVYDAQTQKLSEIRQYSWRKSIPEKQRFMYPDGSILVFYLTESVHLLTANGTIYQSGPLNNDFLETYMEMPEMEEELSKTAYKFQYELEYIKQFYKYLDTENYLLTTSEGYNFKVQNGHIVQENHKYLTLEWFDYDLGERCSLREDGVKTVASKDKFICYYPDGTFITSKIKDDMLYISRDDEGAESFTVLPQEIDGHTVSAVAVTESIIKELVNIACDELFVFITPSHLIQHECYATVHFIKDEKVDIRSPGDVNLSFTGKEVNFDLGGELTLRCREDECIINSVEKLRKDDVGKDSKYERNFLMATINFKQDKDLLLNFIERQRQITVSNDFIWETTSTKKAKYFYKKPPSDLVFEPSLEGFELFSEDDVVNIFSTVEKQKNTITYFEQDLKVILQPFTTFNKIYRLPIGLKVFLKKFEVHDFICKKNHEEKKNICETLKDIMMVRSFYKIDKMQRTMYQSNVNLLLRASLGRTYGNKSIINKMTLIMKAVNTAIRHNKLESENVRTEEAATLKGRQSQTIMDHLKRKNERQNVYKRMLRHKLLPTFWDFKKFDEDIKNMCVCKYAKQLGMVDDTVANEFLYQPLLVLKHIEKTRNSEDDYSESDDIEFTCTCDKKSKFSMEKKETEEKMLETFSSEHFEDGGIVYAPPCTCKNVEKGTCVCPIDINVLFECKEGQRPSRESKND